MDTLCTSTGRASVAPARALLPGILVVDDDAPIRLLLEVALRQRGFAVLTASNGDEALEVYRLHRHEIALVLLDVCMPVLDGPQTVSALRQLEPALRFCFMTGRSGDYSPAQLLELGAACVFEKPFSVAEVLETIEQLTGRASVGK